jgi:hypothetical protein
MPVLHTYRCYLIDAQSHFARAEVIRCARDDEARLRARKLLAEKPDYRAVEVWEGDRRVGTYPASDLASTAQVAAPQRQQASE